MRNRNIRTTLGTAGLAFGGLALVGACNTDTPTATRDAGVALAETGTPASESGMFVDRSVTPALVRNVMSGVEVTTLLSSDDIVPGTPNFVFGGSVDGMGLLRNANGSFLLLANNEDNFAVARIALDQNLRPIAGQYAVNSTNGLFRLCSATLATPAEHGFGPLFLTAGESSQESQIRALTPYSAPNSSVAVPALGRWNAEQAVPLPVRSFEGRTVIVIGDDDSGTYGGQLAIYVADQVGDLQNGRLYVLARADGNTRERDVVVGQRYEVVFKQVTGQQSLTGLQINQRGQELGALPFGRVEDVDYRRGSAANGREVIFAVTGQNNTGVNADYSRSKYGRIYRLTLNPTDPAGSGVLEVLLDGDDRAGPAREFENPDNVTVTENNVYIQEDPNGYGDETHDSRLYQYDLRTGALRTVLEADHRRDQPDAAKYNVGGISELGDWELSGMIDVSEETGQPGTFLLGVQAHTWRGERYRNPDRGTIRPNENQASQIVVLRGLAQ